MSDFVEFKIQYIEDLNPSKDIQLLINTSQPYTITKFEVTPKALRTISKKKTGIMDSTSINNTLQQIPLFLCLKDSNFPNTSFTLSRFRLPEMSIRNTVSEVEDLSVGRTSQLYMGSSIPFELREMEIILSLTIFYTEYQG